MSEENGQERVLPLRRDAKIKLCVSLQGLEAHIIRQDGSKTECGRRVSWLLRVKPARICAVCVGAVMARNKHKDQPKKNYDYKCGECGATMVRCDPRGKPNRLGQYLVCPAGLDEIEDRKKTDRLADSRTGRKHHLYEVVELARRNIGIRRAQQLQALSEQIPAFDDPAVGKRKQQNAVQEGH